MFPAVRRSVRDRAPLTRGQGAVLVASAGAVFSFGALCFRAAGDVTDWQFLVVRAGSVSLAMVALLAVTHRRGRGRRLAAVEWQHVAAGLVLAAMFTVTILALARTSTATVVLLQGAAPFCAALFGRLWLGERLNPITLAAMVVAAAGIAAMVGTELEAGSTSGVVLAAAIPVGLGLYTVLIRSAGSTADPAVPALVAGAAAAAVATTVVLVNGDGVDLGWRGLAMASIGGGVLLGVGLPIFNVGHRHVPAAEVTMLMMTEVVLAPIWVWIWPGERPSAGTLVGGAVVLLALGGWALAPGSRPP